MTSLNARTPTATQSSQMLELAVALCRLGTTCTDARVTRTQVFQQSMELCKIVNQQQYRLCPMSMSSLKHHYAHQDTNQVQAFSFGYMYSLHRVQACGGCLREERVAQRLAPRALDGLHPQHVEDLLVARAGTHTLYAVTHTHTQQMRLRHVAQG